MSIIEGLKEQARRHEQKEEWRKALDLYQKAIARLAEEDAPDIGLYNRVGDLYIRVGETGPAVDAFEQAVDLYIDAELPNNGIAVCKKILRSVPNRHRVFLRMGQIRAHQGFLVDARTHFLTYAERMQAEGELDEGLRALVEFADAAPDDTEIRLAIAGHFQQHERTPEAVEQLSEGYRSAIRQGLDAETEVFAARLQELRPDLDLDEVAADSAAEPEDATLAFESTALTEIHPFDEDEHPILVTGLGGEAGPDDVLGIGAPLAGALEEVGEAEESWDYGDPLALEGDEVDVPVDDDAEEVLAALELDAGEEDASDAASPLDDAISAIGPDVSHFDRADTGANPLEGFHLMAEGDEADDAEDDDFGDGSLPLLHFDDESDESDDEDDDEMAMDLPYIHVPDAAEGDGIMEAGAAALAAALAGEIEGEDDPGESDDAIAEALEDTRAEAREGITDEPEDAALVVDDEDSAVELARRIAESPDDLDLRQRAVELAHRSGDDASLVEAYLGLGEALRRSGAEARARALFQQAVQLDPTHAAARMALDASTGTERPVMEVASNEDYVDLGALILGDEGEKTTRFVVAYEEPSGDEQADFAKMLTQFKAKVAENVDASDVKAHHDLGTAYKEMGLLDEAVEEFQAALRASPDHLPTYEMLGQTFLDRSTPETAVRVLTRALEAPFEVEDELLGIYYYLGRAHETTGNKEQAREFYERVFSLDINFADVTERLRALR